ncbi:hypothetical protein SZN_09196 [Streptomyces zinciresistens K42]|uniref:Uncharacterized protein n=1 Tax=Streptomyces zinciresistens K42 TaxID=700597 RepID=G2G8M1_9ACTN|nr:hypothetical protein [Streptomyces zinciresistens]EGX60086.1 hypothetical protein SZN_09196 [Streptomyces zinciresistens K42]
MTFAPRTWVVGEVVSAAVMNQEIRDQFNSMFAAWTPYTPAWTSTGTAPSLGNGTIIGRYMKIGRTVICHINMTTGSTSTYGSGDYNWSLPVQAANVGTAIVGTAQLLGTDRWVGQIVIGPNASGCSAFMPITATNTRTNFLTATRPETLAAGAQVRLTFMYEAAS